MAKTYVLKIIIIFTTFLFIFDALAQTQSNTPVTTSSGCLCSCDPLAIGTFPSGCGNPSSKNSKYRLEASNCSSNFDASGNIKCEGDCKWQCWIEADKAWYPPKDSEIEMLSKCGATPKSKSLSGSKVEAKDF